MRQLRASLAVLLSLQLSMPSLFVFGQAAPIAPKQSNARKPYQADQIHGDERILHALNRFTFGLRPGDLDAVKAIGLDQWFAQQLQPVSIDESTLTAHLGDFPSMQWNTEDMLYRLPSNAVIRQAADGKIAVPASGALHVIYVNEIDRYRDRQKQKELQKQQAALPANEGMSSASSQQNSLGTESGSPVIAMPANTNTNQPAPDPALIERILALPPAQRLVSLESMQQPAFDSFRKALKGPQRLALIAGMNPAQKEIASALEGPQRVVSEELVAERVTRDIYSNAQLQEVMTDFWLNHFNVFLHKNDETPYYLADYERNVIRPRALGSFEDLLEAVAHSPAMLLYLDNSTSIGPDSPVAEKAKAAASRRPDAKKKAPEGLNENYARELMELHTLGVNGGYTQADVTQVARVLTGWTVDRPQRGGGFKFDESRHEPGTKKVLGKKIKEHGEEEGRQLLHLLATRPATAKFISRKLAVRFVGDEPPQALVDRMAKSYLSSNGNISDVLMTLYRSPEFWSGDAYRAKVKTPLEFVVSAVRSSGASIDNLQPLTNALRDMGMPVYGAVPPTGYKWDASDWISTGALVNRMNFALNLAANKLPGISIAWIPQAAAAQANSRLTNDSPSQSLAQSEAINAAPFPIATPESEEQRLESLLVASGISATTRTALLQQFSSQIQAQNQAGSKPVSASTRPMNPSQAANAQERQDQLLAGLLLGSPEFQRR